MKSRKQFQNRAKSSIVHLHITILDNWRTPSAFPCCGCLRISSSWICGDDCWPVSESGAENILASDSSSESPTPGWFFVPGKDSSWRFGSAHQNSQLVDGFFSTRDLLALAGVESLSLSAKKETEVKLILLFDCQADFCFRQALARRCRTISSSTHWFLIDYAGNVVLFTNALISFWS